MSWVDFDLGRWRRTEIVLRVVLEWVLAAIEGTLRAIAWLLRGGR